MEPEELQEGGGQLAIFGKTYGYCCGGCGWLGYCMSHKIAFFPGLLHHDPVSFFCFAVHRCSWSWPLERHRAIIDGEIMHCAISSFFFLPCLLSVSCFCPPSPSLSVSLTLSLQVCWWLGLNDEQSHSVCCL